MARSVRVLSVLRVSRWRTASECSEAPGCAEVRVLRGSRWRTASECSEAPGCSACSDLTGLRVFGAPLACRVFAVFANCCTGACLGVRGAGNECPLTHEASRRACARLPWKSVIHTVSLSRQAVCQSISHSYSKSKQTAFCQTFDFT